MSNVNKIRLINLKPDIWCFGGSQNSNRTDRSELGGRFEKTRFKFSALFDKHKSDDLGRDKHEKNWQASNVLTSIKRADKDKTNASHPLTVPIPMFIDGSFCAHNRLVVTVLHYLYSTLLYLKEFLARNRQAEFSPERFPTKSFLTARKTRRKQIDWWVGLKMGSTSF